MKKTNTSKFGGGIPKILIYGKTGTGKTTLIRNLPEKETLILNLEQQGKIRLKGKNFDLWELENWVDVQNSFKELLLEENKKKYKYIVIDSLSHINEFAKEWIIRKDRPMVKGDDLGKLYPDLMTMNDYGLLRTRLTRLLISFSTLEYCVIFLARESDTKNDLTGGITHATDLHGPLSTNLGAYFSDVYRLIVRNTEDKKFSNLFICQKTEDSIAKGDPALDIYETGTGGTVDIYSILKRIMEPIKKQKGE